MKKIILTLALIFLAGCGLPKPVTNMVDSGMDIFDDHASRKIWPIDLAMIKIIKKNHKDIHLLIDISNISSSGIGNTQFDEEAFRSFEFNDAAGHYLQLFSKSYRAKGSSIIDRTETDRILREFAFQMKGLVSESSRAKIGEMSGANYILDISVSYWKGFRGSGVVVTKNVNRKLIDIESGEVLAIDSSFAYVEK
jgi:hypothetical protein